MTESVEHYEDGNPAVDVEILENLVLDNPELDKLERYLEQFNIFEALGSVRQEARHSDFLSYLLNPRQNHGLSDVFLKRLLQKAASAFDGVGGMVSPIRLEVWSLDQALVYREHQGLDIFVTDEINHLAVIIENKIDSREHSKQLQRYYELVQRQYPGFDVIAILLTPDGDPPSDDRYIAIDYSQVASLIEDLIQSKASTLGNEIFTLLDHYARLLRRHIVTDSEIR